MDEQVVALTMNEVGDLPSELLMQPLPYILFIGLDLNLTEHLNIWNYFTVQRSSDRPLITYRLFNQNFSLIASKPKKSSYEWHMPKGIIKSFWLNKHLFEIPSLIVLFINLEWTDSDWETAKTNCITQIEYVKQQIIGRSTRIALVLLQKNATIPDDPLASERAAILCNACDLSAKSLFVLPISDQQNLFGYIIRMETVFYDISRSYYQYECKTIKNHKDELNKTTHQHLFVRHSFKIAFFNEIRLEFQAAIKAYKQAYAYLMEFRFTATNLLEIKTIAGFLNYKICKLLFIQNDPVDALSQFRKHIDIFKGKSEPKEIEFEHCAWMSKQFNYFGDLFDQSINAGLIPSQTQHPGYYYYEASLLSINRKKLSYQLCAHSLSYNKDYYTKMTFMSTPLEFYGQRPWRPGCQSINPLDMEKEKEGLLYLQYNEITTVNHSTIIINSLTNALTNYKKNKCPRMARYMMALIADEYFYARDYINSLIFTNQVIAFYRNEKWQPILSNCIANAVKSSFLSINIIEFIKSSFEYLSSENKCSSNDEKLLIKNLLTNILDYKTVDNFTNENNFFVTDIFANATNLWLNELNSITEPRHLTMNMQNYLKFLNIKLAFNLDCYSIENEISMIIYIENNCEKEINIGKLRVLFSNQYYNDFCSINGENLLEKLKIRLSTGEFVNANSLTLIPFNLYSIELKFLPNIEDAGKTIEIIGCSLLTCHANVNVLFSWTFQSKQQQEEKQRLQKKYFLLNKFSKFFNQIEEKLVTTITNKDVKAIFEVKQNQPALYNEFYPIEFQIKNEEIDNLISNLRLSITSNTQESTSEQATETDKIYFNGKCYKFNEEINFNEKLAHNQELKNHIYFQSFLVKPNESLSLMFKYDIESVSTKLDNSSPSVPSITTNTKTIEMDFEIITPFSYSFQLFNIRKNLISYLHVLEPFILRVDLRSLSPHELIITKLTMELEDYIHLSSGNENEFKTKTLCLNNWIERDYNIVCDKEISSPTSFGNLVIEWKRHNESTLNITKILLPEIIVQKSLLHVEVELPEYGIARQNLQLTFIIYNREDDLLPLELSMENSDNFMYSGNKQVKFSIPARSSVKQHYILYPLVCGYVALPKLRLVAYPDTSQAVPMDTLLEGLLPAFLQVMPQEKILTTRFEEVISV